MRRYWSPEVPLLPALFLLAGRWCRTTTGLYRPYYEALLVRGKPKTSAVCAVARKLVPMLLRVMQTAEPFDLSAGGRIGTTARRTPPNAREERCDAGVSEPSVGGGGLTHT